MKRPSKQSSLNEHTYRGEEGLTSSVTHGGPTFQHLTKFFPEMTAAAERNTRDLDLILHGHGLNHRRQQSNEEAVALLRNTLTVDEATLLATVLAQPATFWSLTELSLQDLLDLNLGTIEENLRFCIDKIAKEWNPSVAYRNAEALLIEEGAKAAFNLSDAPLLEPDEFMLDQVVRLRRYCAPILAKVLTAIAEVTQAEFLRSGFSGYVLATRSLEPLASFDSSQIHTDGAFIVNVPPLTEWLLCKDLLPTASGPVDGLLVTALIPIERIIGSRAFGLGPVKADILVIGGPLTVQIGPYSGSS